MFLSAFKISVVFKIMRTDYTDIFTYIDVFSLIIYFEKLNIILKSRDWNRTEKNRSGSQKPLKYWEPEPNFNIFK